MRAMILAAGLGTRLRPLTLVCPKPLVPVMRATILEYWIHQLSREGVEAIVVNAFHLAERLVAAVEARSWPVPVEVRTEPLLLGTGGGIRNVLDFFGDAPFAVVNSDILCRVPLRALFEAHCRSGAQASLLLHDCAPFNNVAVSREGAVLEFGAPAFRLAQSRSDVRLLAFTGIHFLHPAVLKDLPKCEPADILASYRGLIASGRPPQALFADGLHWREMGALDAYRSLHQELADLPTGFFPSIPTGVRRQIAPDAVIAPDALLRGVVVIGSGSQVGAGAVIEDSILWDRVRVAPGSRLRRCIVTDGMQVAGTVENQVLSEVTDGHHS